MNSDRNKGYTLDPCSPQTGSLPYCERENVISPVGINFHHLITFYVVAKERSFSEAARKLFLTQPAVTQHIRALESFSGVKLFNVRRKKVSLTEVGENLFGYAEQIYRQTKSAERLLENAKVNSFRVGASSWFSTAVARAAARFESLFPDIRLHIRYGPSYAMVAELLDLQHDLVLVASMDYGTSNLKAVRVLGMQKWVIVAGCSTAIPDTDRLSLSNLCEFPVLIPPQGSALRELLMRRLRAEGLELKHPIVVQTEYLECLRRFAEKGRAIGILPEILICEDIIGDRLRILPFADYIEGTADVLIPTDICPHSRTDAFVELIKEAFRNSIS